MCCVSFPHRAISAETGLTRQALLSGRTPAACHNTPQSDLNACEFVLPGRLPYHRRQVPHPRHPRADVLAKTLAHCMGAMRCSRMERAHMCIAAPGSACAMCAARIQSCDPARLALLLHTRRHRGPGGGGMRPLSKVEAASLRLARMPQITTVAHRNAAPDIGAAFRFELRSIVIMAAGQA